MRPYGDCARRKTSLCVQEVHLGVSLFAVKTARETPCTQVWAHLCISISEMPCATDEIGRPVPFTCVHCFALGEKNRRTSAPIGMYHTMMRGFFSSPCLRFFSSSNSMIVCLKFFAPRCAMRGLSRYVFERPAIGPTAITLRSTRPFIALHT